MIRNIKIILCFLFTLYFGIALYGDIRLANPIRVAHIAMFLAFEFFWYNLYINVKFVYEQFKRRAK